MDWFLVRRRVETPGETSPGETSSESSTSHPITSGSCASTEGTSDEYCHRDSEAAASATFRLAILNYVSTVTASARFIKTGS